MPLAHRFCTLHSTLCIDVVPEVGSAPTSPPLQGGANLPQLLGVKMVVPAGNAPASSGYQPGALLLSYRTMAEGVGSAPTSVVTDPVFETGAASLYLPAFHKWLPGLDSHQHRTA